MALVFLGLAAACASPRVAEVARPVGPVPRSIDPELMGRLVVFTEMTSVGSGQEQTEIPLSYKIYDLSGRLMAEVENSSGQDVVELEPGRYRVRQAVPRQGAIEVEAVVKTGRTTEVHLERNWKPTPGASVVLGLDGQPVGYTIQTGTVTGKK